MSFISKIFGDANQRYLNKISELVEKINRLETSFEAFSYLQLRDKTGELKKRLSGGADINDILPEAFAVVREASKRTLGQRHFDVQLMGGIVLHQGKISEMKTGEGKTLVATLPSYLNALSGHGVHIVTVNDYLARRDAAWMGQIYHALGLTVGCINHDSSYLYDPLHKDTKNAQEETQKKEQKEKDLDKERDTLGSFKVVYEFLRPVTRREAYTADITYGTNNEFGFDYLRDNLVYSLDQKVQRGHNYAIVDEVDSILIDEARTPLIISAPDAESTNLYGTFSKITPHLVKDEDFTVDEKLRSVLITEKGIEKVEHALGMKNIYDHGGMRYVHHLEQALRAHVLFHKDKDYVVKNGEVIIVDEFTGRLMPGRRWSEGLHQAIESKEKVEVQKETRTFATITFQNYFRLYKKLAGMTGTASTSAEEFHKVYNLDVVLIPTNKSLVREDLADRIYKTEGAKWKAVIEEIKICNQRGQPVLVGTTSIEKNELLSAMLRREGIKHEILNAKNHEREGEIIAQAGRFNGVTIATNMAGRGVDVILGGNPPVLEDIQKVREAGGLHVIGTERHEARRTDNQLRGRSGRQGDPGSSQFMVSLDDDLIRIFGGDRIKSLMDRFGLPEDQPIEHSFISKAIEQAQSKVEGNNFDARKYVLEFDDVMNKHRGTIYGMRNKILEVRAEDKESSSKQIILTYLDNFISELVNVHIAASKEPKELENVIRTITNSEFKLDEKLLETPEELKNGISDFVEDLYEQKEQKEGNKTMREIENFVLLRTIDELWVDHLETMEYLRDSVRLRAYGQRDPLVEYKLEGQKLFERLLSSIGHHVAQTIFKVGSVAQTSVNKSIGFNLNAGKEKPGGKDIGRNDPCFCGSGKKYKRCHGK